MRRDEREGRAAKWRGEERRIEEEKGGEEKGGEVKEMRREKGEGEERSR